MLRQQKNRLRCSLSKPSLGLSHGPEFHSVTPAHGKATTLITANDTRTRGDGVGCRMGGSLCFRLGNRLDEADLP